LNQDSNLELRTRNGNLKTMISLAAFIIV